MKTATEIAEEAIYRDEITDAGEGAGNDDSTKTDKDAAPAGSDDKGDSNGGDADKGAGSADDGSAGADDGKADKDDEGKFTADDALEVDEPAAPKADDAPKDTAGVQISPQEGKYIADNIGEPIVLRGIQGEGDNAKEVELKVYSPNEIPRNFKFASDADRIMAQNGFQSLERRAQQLLGDFRNQQSTKQAQDFERRENQGIRDDISDLQKAGEFPKFKVKPGDAGFESDPAAKQVDEVVKLMTERNDQYLKEYQQGRPYRHIGFREAFELHQARQSASKAKQARDSAQADEDKARKGVADKVGTGRGLTTDKVQKPTVPRGTTVSDILNKYDSEDW